MLPRRRPSLIRLSALAAVLAAASAAAAAAAPEPASPHQQCYAAARAGTGNPYPCDLAVEAARSQGASALLAAALANRSLTFAAAGRIEPALADLNAALELRPDDAALHGNRGNLLLRLGRAGEALAAHDRAAALAGGDPIAEYNRAFSYRAAGDPLRAARIVEALSGREGAVR
ncbi:MAG: tetratricopeptide repeat protein [Pseudomonadales bacterium]